jgi:hypothetical protein
MISLILVLVASVSNAIMDTCVHHYYKSIFMTHNNWDIYYFFNGEFSWKNKYKDRDPQMGRRKLFWNINYPVQFTDAFHLFKTIMIISLIFAIVFYQPIFNWWLDIILLGTVWNCTFSLFYNKLLIR